MPVNWPYEFPGAYWLDEKEDLAVQDVLHHGSLFRYYGLGTPKYVDAFEEAARRYYGAQHALAVNSGTGALMAAMSALEIGPGCEVILPAFLWVATVASVIPVLEDCAQCNGGTYHGRKLGTIGRMGIFSLQLNKNITCGEGGLLITDDERLYHRAFSAHDMGMIRVAGRLAMPEPYAVAWGAGRRMTELCGAVISVQLEKLDRILDSMRNSKRRIKAMLGDVPGLAFRCMNDAEGDAGAFLVMLLEAEARAAAVAQRLKAAGLHNVPPPQWPIIRSTGAGPVGTCRGVHNSNNLLASNRNNNPTNENNKSGTCTMSTYDLVLTTHNSVYRRIDGFAAKLQRLFRPKLGLFGLPTGLTPLGPTDMLTRLSKPLSSGVVRFCSVSTVFGGRAGRGGCPSNR